MNQSAHGKNRFHERLSRAQIHILGSLQLQNELFAGALADATGLKCSCSSNVSFPELNASDEEGDNMILWDCVDDDNQEILWEKIDPSFMLENVFLFCLMLRLTINWKIRL